MARTLVMTSDPSAPSAADGEFFMLGGTYLNLAVLTEAARQASARVAGHFCFLGGESPSSAPAGQQLQFRKNGADGTQIVTLQSGWSETANQDVLTSGDLWDIKVVNGTGSSALSTARAVFSADNDLHATYHIAWSNQSPAASGSGYYALAGDGGGGGGLPEAQIQVKYSVAGTLANLQVYVVSNPATGNTTFRVRINGVNGNGLITIPAGATGLFEDTSNTDAIAAGDLVSIAYTGGGGAGNFHHSFIGASFTATSGSSSDVFGTRYSDSVTGTKYIPISGYARTGSSTESFAKCRVGFPATLSKIRFYISANTRTADTVITLRVNGADAANTVTVPALTTGWFEDTTSSDIVGESDDVDLSIVTASPARTFTIATYGVQITDNGGGTPCNPPTPVPPVTTSTGSTVYYIERLDNRTWPTIEDAWCLDAALQWPMPTPAATLTASANGTANNIGLYTVVNGGSGYTAPTGQVLDANPNGGSGAQVGLTVSGGIITNAAYSALGSGYINPYVTVLDSTGTGAVIQPIITNYTTFSTTVGVFTSTDVGSIIRMGGGKAEVITVASTTSVTANITTPITAVYANDPYNTPLPAASGSWTLTAPVTTVSGLDHLEGMTVAAIADGGAVTGLTVSAGSVTLPYSASQIVVGLPFTAQLQTLYLESPGGATLQTRRKNDTQVVLRVRDSAAPEVGVNQPDASTQPNQANVPWGAAPYTSMSQVVSRTPNVPAGTAVPLLSGDFPITNVFSTYDTKAQVAVQQTKPLPLTVLALVPWVTVGDSPGP